MYVNQIQCNVTYLFQISSPDVLRISLRIAASIDDLPLPDLPTHTVNLPKNIPNYTVLCMKARQQFTSYLN